MTVTDREIDLGLQVATLQVQQFVHITGGARSMRSRRTAAEIGRES
jgi:hypothetical protein